MWTKFGVFALSSSFLTIYILKKYFGGRYCNCKNRLDGKTVIVTGATSGIGRETAIILALKGAEVIIACRNLEKGEEVACDIRQKTGNLLVRAEQLDLSHFKSIIDFVNRFRKEGTKLYGIVNNAGLFHVPFQLTEDGFDVTLQTNYLGPFLLTHLLLDLIKDSSPSRVVNIGSESHRYPEKLNVSELTRHYSEQDNFDKFVFYGTSKLCLMLFTSKLAKLLDGSGVTVNSVNPGNVRSNIHRNFAAIRDLPALSLSRFLLWLTFKTPHQGAQTVIHILTDPRLASVTGKYFSDCSERDISDLAKSSHLEDELWESTLTWLQPFLNETERRVEL